MTTPTQYFPWFSLLFVCGIALLLSCSDNGGPDQRTMEITRISPDSGAVGTRVTVYSNSIDPEHSKNQVEINGTPVPIISYNSNKLVVEVPEGISSGQVTLEVNSKVANGPYFKVLTEGPVIEQVTPGRGGPGTPVTITGDHFLPPSAMAKVSGDSTEGMAEAGDSLQAEVTLKAKGEPAPNINGLPVSVAFGDRLAPLLSLSNTEIIAEVPEGATSGVITLTVDGQTATHEAFRLILPPVISEVTPTAGPVGTTVTITGENFSATKAENTVTFNGAEAAVSSASTTELTVSVPADATTGAVKVAVGSQTAEGPTFTVTENHAPTITSNASFEIEEHTTEVGTITATDPEGDALTYSLAGGADQGLFSIGENSGALTFTTAPDFENPGDTGGDNIYEVQVQASDGDQRATQLVSVRILDVAEAPAFFLAGNGATIKCPEAEVGQTGVVNGKAYTRRLRNQITPANAAATCTSGITDMSGLFVGVSDFNGDISHWDVSSVTDMSNMFDFTTSFNRDLSGWDVSSVTDM